jgi:hypothetical protein
MKHEPLLIPFLRCYCHAYTLCTNRATEAGVGEESSVVHAVSDARAALATVRRALEQSDEPSQLAHDVLAALSLAVAAERAFAEAKQKKDSLDRSAVVTNLQRIFLNTYVYSTTQCSAIVVLVCDVGLRLCIHCSSCWWCTSSSGADADTTIVLILRYTLYIRVLQGGCCSWT